MALINTEEAAKRLARVILSDIELYNRERPQPGQTLTAQIEEGRRLFGSRVAPAIVPLFDVVLADRRTANGKTPALTATPFVPVRSASAERALDDQPTPGPRLVAQILDDQPTPGPRLVAQILDDRPTPGPRLVAQILDDRPTPVRLIAAPEHAERPEPGLTITQRIVADQPAAAPVAAASAFGSGPPPGPVLWALAANEPTPAPAPGRKLEPRRAAQPAPRTAPRTAQESPVARAPVDSPASMPSAMVAGAPSAMRFPAAVPEVPVPVLTSRIPILRLLLVVAIAVSAVALISRYLL